MLKEKQKIKIENVDKNNSIIKIVDGVVDKITDKTAIITIYRHGVAVVEKMDVERMIVVSSANYGTVHTSIGSSNEAVGAQACRSKIIKAASHKTLRKYTLAQLKQITQILEQTQ